MMEMRSVLPGSYELAVRVIKSIIGPNLKDAAVIDLCSYIGTTMRMIPTKETTFVDVMDLSEQMKGVRFVQADVISGNHPVFNMRYDVATCLDGIEHMHKPEGVKLLQRMVKLANKQIVFTPLHAWKVDPESTDPEVHKCVWLPEDFPGWGRIIFPDWHRELNIGAHFAWGCANIEEDFIRVKRELGFND